MIILDVNIDGPTPCQPKYGELEQHHFTLKNVIYLDRCLAR